MEHTNGALGLNKTEVLHISHLQVNHFKLTRREYETLQKISEGMSTKQIAGTLFISENTVETHRRKILKKLNAGNIVQAVVIAMRSKLLN